MKAKAVTQKDTRVDELIEQICATIKTKFSDATFEVCDHPTHRGAIIDADVPTDDDFEVLDLVNPALDDLLIDEDIAIYVRALNSGANA